MKDLDLNIFPVYYAKQPTLDALLSLVNNNYVTTTSYNHDNSLAIEYDPNKQMLKFTLHHWSIRAVYFIQQETSDLTFPLTLLEATAILTSQGKHLVFNSKFGTFTSYLKQKEGIDDPLPCLYLHWEPKTSVKNYQAVKNLFNEEDNDLTDTTITIDPIPYKLVTNLQNQLAWWWDWKEVIKSSNGYLLIANINQPHTIYLDGIDFTNAISNQPSSFLYSYDIDASLIDGIDNNASDYFVGQIIYLILDGLSEENKKKIFPTFLNNEQAKEWTFSNVQVLILNYLNKLNPGQYVLCVNDDQPYPDYVQLATKDHKTLVKVTKDAYLTLQKEIDSIYTFGSNWIKDNFETEYVNYDLTFREQNNFNILIQFMNYLQEHYQAFKQLLTKEKIKSLRWWIFENYPSNGATYIWRYNACVIARSSLVNLPTLFDSACDAVWRYVIDIRYKDFRDAWLANTISFFHTYHIKKQDWDVWPSKKELKKQNKKWS